MADDRPAPSLYEQDFYAWTQVQAEALRLRGGRPSNVLDWKHIAEEIEGLGAAERNAVRSHLQQIIAHLLKLEFSRALPPRAGWRVEVATYRVEVETRMTATIRNEMERDLDLLHRRGAALAQKSLDEYERGVRLDAARRWTLAQLLGEADDPLDGGR